MLSSIFRPKWQHKDEHVRKQAIASLDPQQDKALLVKIAQSDDSEAVRHCAIGRLINLQALYQLFQHTAFSQDKRFIQQCWCAVLANPDLTSSLQAENYVLDCHDKNWLAAIASYCNHPSLQELALTGLNDEATIFALLQDNQLSRLWPALVDRLSSDEALKQALALVKGRDKKTTQYIKQRLDILQQQRSEQQAQHEQAQHLHDKLQQLLASEHTPLLEGILLSLAAPIEALDTQHALSAKIQQLYQQCQQKLHQQQSQQAVKNQQQQALQQAEQLFEQLQQQLSFDESQQQDYQRLLTDSAHHAELAASLKRIESLQQAIKRIQAQLQDIEQSPAQDKLHVIQNAIALCQKHPGLSRHYLASLKQQQAQYQHNKKQQKQEKIHDNQTIKALIQQADEAIANSDFAKLEPLYQQARKRIGAEQSASEQAALARMQAAMQTFYDWRKFAVEPKRQELCQAMQALIDSPMNISERAAAIKQLQEQWKALGYCKNAALWQQFHQLSEQAYAPCKAFYSKQHDIKAFNAEQKNTICQHLEQLLATIDWAQADYASLDRLAWKIKQEWNKYHPVSHHDHQDLQGRFQALMQQFNAPLQQEKQKNTAILEALVKQAQQLSEQEAAQEAISHYQQLHEQWKTVGICFRQSQQTLWQALKEAGNVLYEKRNQLRQENEDSLNNNLHQAQQIIQRIRQASQADEVKTLQQDFEQLGNVPKAQLKTVRQDFYQALKHFEQQQSQKQKQHCLAQLASIKQWSEQCAEQEQQGQASLPVPSDLPDDWQAVLEKRFTASQSDDARSLVIQLELLLDRASPEEDQSLRMQLQMQQLSEHFQSANRHDSQQQLIQLLLQFYALPCHAAPLQARVEAILNHLSTELL